MHTVRFSIALSADRYLAYYKGLARAVVVKAHDGRTVQFPADVLRPFLTHEGVYGEFELRFDEGRKFLGIARVEDSS